VFEKSLNQMLDNDDETQKFFFYAAEGAEPVLQMKKDDQSVQKINFQGPFKKHAIIAVREDMDKNGKHELEAALTHVARTISSTKAVHYIVDSSFAEAFTYFGIAKADQPLLIIWDSESGDKYRLPKGTAITKESASAFTTSVLAGQIDPYYKSADPVSMCIDRKDIFAPSCCYCLWALLLRWRIHRSPRR
jgi:hypothetical protein